MRLLIVEDEKELADGLALLFERSGYTVNICYDGVSGLDEILSGVYDLAVLDIMLPGKDGISVLKTARGQGCRTQVIMLTAKSETMDKVQGLDCGADDYLTKPFDAAELLARVRARIRGGDYSESEELSFGDISLSRARQEMSCRDRKVKLGHKEYELMEYLLVNGGHILTKDMLISRVWDPEEEPEYNHLEVYISFLRKKLRFIKAKVSIVTTKNVGYSLEEPPR